MYVCQLSFFLHSQIEKKICPNSLPIPISKSSAIWLFRFSIELCGFHQSEQCNGRPSVDSEPGLQEVSCHSPSLFLHPHPSWLTWVTRWHFKQSHINTVARVEGQTSEHPANSRKATKSNFNSPHTHEWSSQQTWVVQNHNHQLLCAIKTNLQFVSAHDAWAYDNLTVGHKFLGLVGFFFFCMLRNIN